MPIIPWLSLAANILWIAGLTLVLATFSYNRCMATRCKIGLARPNPQPATGPLLPIGLLLVSLGLAATSASWLERGIWLSIALLLIAWAVRQKRIRIDE